MATFFSHHEAVKFSRRLGEMGIAARMMPVPRKVSTSCGTGVRFEAELLPPRLEGPGVDRIFILEGDAYRLVFQCED